MTEVTAGSGGRATADFRIKKHDSLPDLLASFTERDPESLDQNARRPLDLTLVDEAWLFGRTRDRKHRLAGECQVDPVDEDDPVWAQYPLLTPYPYKLRYLWQSTDTSISGIFYSEFELRFAGGSVQTVPARGTFQIVIEEDQG